MGNRNIILYKWFNFFLGLSFYAPVAIIYFSQVSGSYTLGASIIAITMIVSALVEVPTGIWSDKMGRRRTIIIGSALTIMGGVVYALSQNYNWLVLGSILEGFSRSFFSGNNDAFLYESSIDAGARNNYDDFLGKAHSMEHLGIALGAVIGGFIATYSLRLSVSLTVIPLVGSLICSILMSETRSQHTSASNIYAHTKAALKLFIHNKKLRLLSISDAISFATGETSYQFRATFFASIWPVWAIGLLNTALQFGASVSYYFSAWLIKKWGAEKLLVIRSIVGKISGLIAFGVPSVLSPIVTFFPSFLYGAGQVAKNTLMQNQFSSKQRATMSSLNSLLSNLTFAIATIMIGFVADKTTPQIALLGITIISLPIVAIYWNIFANHQET